MDKIARIVSRACMCSDDGRALSLEWQLFLNDYGGSGFWHGGPGSPRHGKTFGTEASARAEASRLGYRVTDVQWS